MFVTHRREDGSFQPLREHLTNVAELAGAFARAIGSPEEGYRTGLLHDIGKYSSAAQARQRDPEHVAPVDHSSAGVQVAARVLKDIPAAFAIAGHHGGLSEESDEGFMMRFVKPLTGANDPSEWKREISVSAQTDEPEWVKRRFESPEAAMYTRMLFSCLVDADFLDTERAIQGETARGGFAEIPELLEKLNKHVAPWLESPRNELCARRSEILARCLHGGEEEKGLFTLTVPTGGGKTIASLAFALSHAKAHGLRRVIYVIPYTSIIEQTAEVFAGILGRENVLEHHSQAEFGGEDGEDIAAMRRRFACENWDAPVIVTTAVQFFESMYARRTSRCRKLHNIAESVVIFDEAQTMPVSLLKPCVFAIAELVRHYGATAVLCTATQPALEKLFYECAPEIRMRELAPDPDGLFEFFRRVSFAFEGAMTDAEVAARLAGEEQVLAIVNTRRRAREIFQMLPADGRFHLSTLMTAEDRAKTLSIIRARLNRGERCRVVSTSLVEAGVDVDFPAVWREMTGLDSILQAAGRCNREGKRAAEESCVHIFEGEGRVNPELMLRISPARAVLEAHLEIHSREAVAMYFRRLIWASGDENLDKPRILQSESRLHFRQTADNFRMIDDRGARTVYVPTGENADDLDALRQGFVSRALMRRLGRTAVNVMGYEYDSLLKSGAVEDHAAEGYGILLNMDAYSAECGLNVRCEGWAAFFA